MPGPILREYWTGNRAVWLVDFSYWPSDCLSRVIKCCFELTSVFAFYARLNPSQVLNAKRITIKAVSCQCLDAFPVIYLKYGNVHVLFFFRQMKYSDNTVVYQDFKGSLISLRSRRDFFRASAHIVKFCRHLEFFGNQFYCRSDNTPNIKEGILKKLI